jgi:hypothetical protein
VGRLETLDQDMATIMSKIEGNAIAPIESPRLNTTKGNHTLSDTSVEKITRVYSRDFNFWGYKKIC